MAKPSLDGPIPRPSAPAISLYPAGPRRKRRPAGRVRDDHTVRGAILEPSGIVRVSARPDFLYREKLSSDLTFMQRPSGTMFNVTSAMLAVTIQDALYGVAAPGLQWNIRLALVWTKVEVSDDNSLLKLAFQWRFHEHPHPFQLLEWSHEWREFVRRFQAMEQEVDRIAYAWIFYQLDWLQVGTNGAPPPLETEYLINDHWEQLLRVNQSWDEGEGWRTRTLPLLARPEVGLPPIVQSYLLLFASSDADSQDRSRQREWLRAQRRRLVTDAIIAAEEEEGRRAEDAENEERVGRIVEGFEAQHRKTHGEESPWWTRVERQPDGSP